MGRSLSTALDAVDQPISVTAQDTISAGDLVKIDAGGWANKVTEAFPIATQNSALGTSSAVASASMASNYGNVAPAYGRGIKCVVPLADGGFIHVFSGNGATRTTGANVGFYTAGAALRTTVVLGSTANCLGMRVTRAGADNVLVVWAETADLRIAVVNATTGAIVLASTSIGTLGSSIDSSFNLATLPNGEVVIAFNSGSDMVFRRYSATGVLQGTQVTAEAAQTPTHITILGQTGGGFIVRWAKTAATQGNRMARFNAAGVLQGAVVAISSAASAFDGAGAGTGNVGGAMEGKLIELSDGSIVSAVVASATSHGFTIYDASLNVLYALPPVTVSADFQDTIQLCPRHGGGFWASGAFSGHKVRQYDNTGGMLREVPTGAQTCVRIIDRPGNGPFIVQMSINTSGPTGTVALYSYRPDLTLESGTNLILASGVAFAIGFFWAERLASGLIQIAYTYYNSSYYLATAYPGGASVLGVAQNSATVGQPVKVATAGKLTMNQNITSPNFDRRASTPPGTAGGAIGNVALLSGVVAT